MIVLLIGGITMTYDGGKPHLPSQIKSEDLAGMGNYRVPNTNKTLARFEFGDLDRDIIFDVFGQQNVLRAMALYFGSPVNAHRDKVLEDPSNFDKDIQNGLVATMESIRTSDYHATESIILGGYDIHARMKNKYSDRGPALRVRDQKEDGFRLEALEGLVDKHIRE